VPYGTDSRLNLFQAINCLATIIQSLRGEDHAALCWTWGAQLTLFPGSLFISFHPQPPVEVPLYR